MANSNPLYTPQREKAGAQTFGKYMYQYHWALYRIFKEHESEKEYAVFIELHEDVVLADSLEVAQVKFEFNQVKTTTGKYTDKKLIKQDPKTKSSTLGKLISSGTNPAYFDKVDSINLVASNGFNIPLKTKGTDLQDISINDISDNCLKSMSDAITKELSSDSFPINLHFIVPDLPEKSFEQTIIGHITEVILKLYPGATINAQNIYRALIDELTRKGRLTFDFTNWDKFIKEKALTSLTVTQVINEHTNRKQDIKVYEELDSFMNDLGLKSLEKRNWKKSFERYYLQRVGNKATNQFDISSDIKTTISKYLPNSNDDITLLLSQAIDSLSEKTKKKFDNDMDIKCAILCELILED